MSSGYENEPEFTDLIDEAIKAALSRHRGPIYGEVTAYHQVKQTADVWPMVNFWIYGQLIRPKILQSIPVLWPGGGQGSLTFRLAPGDVVQLVPQEADVSGWVASGSKHQDPPTEERYKQFSAIPRARSIASPLPPTAYGNGTVLADSTIWLGSSLAADFVALANKVDLALDVIVVFLNALSVVVAEHTHDDPDKPGEYGSAINPEYTHTAIEVAPTGSTKIHAE